MNFILNNLQLLEETAANTGTDMGSLIGSMLPILLIVVFFYMFLLRPQKKKEKEAQTMRENIQIGDEICTIGGLVGIVVKKAEDTIVIETGGDKTKLRVKNWAIQENITVKEAKEAAIKKAKADKLANLPVPVKQEKTESKKDKKGE